MNPKTHSGTFSGAKTTARPRARFWGQVLRLGVALMLAATAVSSAQTYTVLRDFISSDGQWLYGGVVLAGNTLYGTAQSGGGQDYGDVFKINTDGSGFAVLKSFSALRGGCPHAELVLANNTLYGTTSETADIGGYGTVFKLNTDGSGFAVLMSFTDPTGGFESLEQVILGGSTLYGTLAGAGSFGKVFKVNTDGSGYAVLKGFSGLDGSGPEAPMVLKGGTLYGTTGYGGASGYGVVFTLNTDGSGSEVLKSFTGSDGRYPHTLILAGSTLFGLAGGGGSSNAGVIFRLNADGSGFTILKSFTGRDGNNPHGLVLVGQTLYGTADGGSSNAGVVFMIDTNGWGYTVLKNFDGPHGAYPLGKLAFANDTLYGATRAGGQSGYGVVFSLALAPPGPPIIVNQPQDATVHAGGGANFAVVSLGAGVLSYQWRKNGNPLSGATTSTLVLTSIQVADAGVYSVAVSNAGGTTLSRDAVLAVQDPFIDLPPVDRRAAAGETVRFEVIAGGTQPLGYQWSKDGISLNDGGNVSGALSATLTLRQVSDVDVGGYRVAVSNSYGSVTSSAALLRVTMPGSYLILHSFTGLDGAQPAGGLVSSGTTLYGTTVQGGSVPYFTRGTVFKLNTDGSGFSTIKNFTQAQGAADGPSGDLALSGTTLYGTTYMGGTSNYGVLYRIETNGSNYIVLKNFSISDGAEPWGVQLFGDTLYGATTLVPVLFKIDTQGNNFTALRRFPNGGGVQSELLLVGSELYGTGGGDALGTNGGIFKIDISGSNFTVLRSFTGTDGKAPVAGLILSDGQFYGTTAMGGSDGHGTVFRVNTDGSDLTVLKHFAGSDGGYPSTRLVLAGAGLFGTTSEGGTSNAGTIFTLNTDGTGFRVLKSFTGPDGSGPRGLVLVGSTLYGTAAGGGSSNYGVVFSFSVPFPIVVTSPQSQTAETGTTVAFRVTACGYPPPLYQWFFNATNSLGDMTTNSSLRLTNVQPEQAGAYTVVVSNAYGAVESARALLSVIPPVERRWVPGLTLTALPGSVLTLEGANVLAAGPAWTTLDTVALTSPSQWYFDLSAPLPTQKFYRAWQAGIPSEVPSLHLDFVPAITLAGSIGDHIRIDCINQFGPANAWMTLDEVLLTNTSQLYFDISAVGQPPRLWRIVPVP